MPGAANLSALAALRKLDVEKFLYAQIILINYQMK